MKTRTQLNNFFAIVLFSQGVVTTLAQVTSTPLFLYPVSYASGGNAPVSAAVADVNGDGKPDLVVANGNSKNVGVLLGNGDGTFRAVVTYDSGGRGAESVVIADINSDGKPDLIVASGCASTGSSCRGSVGVLLGNGNGTFKAAMSYDSGGVLSWSVAVADVNGDGKLDVIVTNNSDNTVGVLLGNGDGTFKPAVSYPSGSNSFTGSVAVADVNGDGKPDLVVADECLTYPDCASSTVGILLGNGNGTFQSAVTYSAGGSYATTVEVADVNGDGRPDLVVGSGFSDAVSVLLGNGDGTFKAAIVYDLAQTVGSIAVRDVNGDGKPDLLVTGESSQHGAVIAFLGNGDGTFSSPSVYASGGQYPSYPSSLAVADVNGDGKPDLLIANEGSNTIGVLLGNTNVHGSITTTTALVSSLNPAFIRQRVNFTATVSSSLGAPPNGETVTFSDNGIVIATGVITDGLATFGTSNLKTGTQNIRATYIGDATFKKSLSSAVQQAVKLYPTKTALTSKPNPSTLGQAVTFTVNVAKVISAGPTPTGKVTFKDGSKIIGVTTLSNSVATLIKSTLAVGTHSITAEYLGDGSSGKSTSTILNQVVN